MTGPPLAVCVLGMHRSGSSLAAQVLAGNGLRTGRSQIGRSRFNSQGHLEDRFVVGTNKRLLLRFGGSWDRPPRLPEGWLADDRVVRLLRRAERYRERQAEPRAPFFFKDPRSSLLVPFWRTAFGDQLRFLVVLRNPQAVVRSVLRRQQEWLSPERLLWRSARNIYHWSQGALEPLQPLGADEAERLWHHYYRSIVEGLGAQAAVVLVYERLLAEPSGQIERVLAELGLPAGRVETGMVRAALSHSAAAEVSPEVAALEQRLLAARRER